MAAPLRKYKAIEASDVRKGRVVLRVREIEHETTYLDGIELEVRAKRVQPQQRPPRVLRYGDSVALVFAVPDLADGEAEVTLVVSGYYVPDP